MSNQPLHCCTCCLIKFVPDLYKIDGNAIYFFVPTTDEQGIQHYAYICMQKEQLYKIFSGEEGELIDLSEYGQILHIEAGYWPSEERQDEIKRFYGLAAKYALSSNCSQIAA